MPLLTTPSPRALAGLRAAFAPHTDVDVVAEPPVLRYRAVRESPAEALNCITSFLGVETSIVTETTAENVTTHASGSLVNRAAAQALRVLTSLEHRMPGPARQAPGVLGTFLSRHQQREQRPREPLTQHQRVALIPHFTDDVSLLEKLVGESFAEWTDVNRPGNRSDLKPLGRIGMAYGSIDRPIRD
jgi:hypothetical protein